MSVTHDEVKHIATLARLKFDDVRIEQLASEMGRILDYMKQLDEVDTSDIPAMSHVHEGSIALRPDEVVSRIKREDALKNAPDHDGTYFRVPKVIE